jgi:hypothetical protein
MLDTLTHFALTAACLFNTIHCIALSKAAKQ